jgi:hypothetical protein
MKSTKPAGKRQEGGGKLIRTASVTVRLDERLHYLVGLAARKQRRTVSSYIENAVEVSLEKVILHAGNDFQDDSEQTLAGEAKRLWDADASERFVRLAIYWPDLLNHDEQIAWKVMLDSGYLDRAKKRHETSRQIDWDWVILDDAIFPTLRRDWDSLQQAISQGKSKEWIESTRVKLKTQTITAKPRSKSAPQERGDHV